MQAPTNIASLQGKVALVTGGTSGIGRAAAVALAAAGAKVVIGARRQAEGQTLVDEVTAAGGEAAFQATDVTDTEQIASLVSLAVERFGGLDVAFLNAGIEGAGLVPMMEESEQDLRRILEVNFFGVWNSMRAVVPALLERGGGSIISTTSIAGQKGFGAFSSYAASKFAVEGLSRSVAAELAESGVRVNTIAPGPIDTAMLERTTGGDSSMFTSYVPMQRAGTSEEVAALVTFLASDGASYITGHTLRVDGGMLA